MDGLGEIDTVLFDLDGVVIDFRDDGDPDWMLGIMRDEVASFGGDPTVSDRQLLELFAKPGADHFRGVCQEIGVTDPEEFWSRLHERGGEAKLERLRRGDIERYDDVDALGGLSDAYRTGIVSNQSRQSVERVLEYLALTDQFDLISGLDSLESNDHRKPDPSQIERAMEALETERGIYVGNNRRDVTAAKRAGLVPVLLDRNREVPDAERRITSLRELRSELVGDTPA